ncbi:PST family polysaccharide transporter [Clostridium saccharoperbutylacetonicum]|uniref:Polysaccharide biosynthesis protein n=2 Tax=Clostridium saccharoperbutylacetonicum TaxID=36745 RepID=M1LQ29_9CLOT|nr:lipopolysaccharide biosynthesis protein [Clostridium saccharoperbutylacetonicum]AGF54990.1 polysaccharide biosynthesis protein [Clostridium saccharoperbutylacetonicum N1-4(HMT)]NRT64303.1 PST family polysaccharide transporter [Clostridium saccharoperbutylacetonicum]NSB27672.1 PST family polysaccharide transporter [Clostridium saccharoperbutylacetonicum]NSB41159.1 PST family polysaccharide transporter [Clostridium saccharoperbutylacetonicum]
MSNKSKLKNGIMITFIAKYSNVITQLIINSILARLLMPEEFGVIAIITVFISFFNILGDMGIGPAIIQNKSLDDKEISDIFKFSVMGALVIAIGFYFFSYFIAFFYTNRIYIKLGFLLSFSVFFFICNIVPNALIYKKQNFKLVGIINVCANIGVGIITITLALNGWSYYSLIFDSISKSLFIFIFSFTFSKIKIKKGYSYNAVKKIRNYSSYQFLFNFINYFTRNLDNILIGKFLGSSTLGYYDKSYKLMLYPVQNLTNVITPVLHPVLSEYQDQIDVIYDTYIEVVKVLAYIGIFVSVYCFFSSKEIIRIMYGTNWDKSIPAFRILSLSIVIQMVLSSIGSIFQSTGYVNKLFSTGLVSACFTITAIAIGVMSKSLEVLAMGIVISFAFNFIQCFYVLMKHVFNKKFSEFLLNIKNVLIIGFIMVCGYLLTSKISIDNVLISAIVKLVIGIITYLIGLIITKEYKLLKSIIIK